MEKYSYTHGWFLNSEIRHNLMKFVNPFEKHTILEIGSYEGLSSCFLIDNFLHHSNSTLTCVDPFDLADSTTPLTSSTKRTFLLNLSRSKYPEKVSFENTYSNDFFKRNETFFDIIYIDGSHLPVDILFDMNNADKYLLQGGIMWMDDYLGGSDTTIKDTMDIFLNENKDRYTVIHSGYQLGLRKLI